MMRRELEKLRKDFTTTIRTWARASSKVVQDVTPKVSATIDETVEQATAAFRKTMSAAGKETKQFQVSFLTSYKTVLAKQMELIEKRIKELSK